MHTHKTLTSIATLLTSTFLVACGSGGSDEGANQVNSDTEIRDPVTQPEPNNDPLPKVSFVAQQTTAISEANAEVLIGHIYHYMRYTISDLVGVFDNLDFYKGRNASPSNHKDVHASFDEECVRGGKFQLDIIQGADPIQDQQGLRIYNAGTSFQRSFIHCGASFLNAPYKISGTSKTEVLTGMWDGYAFLSDNTALKLTLDNHVIDTIFSDGTNEDAIEYAHGVTYLTLEDESNLSQSSELFIEKKHANYHYSLPYQAHNLDFRFIKTEGTWGWDTEYDLLETGGFKVDFLHDALSVSLEIVQALHFDYATGDIVTGEMRITGQNSVMRLVFHADYIDYFLDNDNNGDFESYQIVNTRDL